MQYASFRRFNVGNFKIIKAVVSLIFNFSQVFIGNLFKGFRRTFYDLEANLVKFKGSFQGTALKGCLWMGGNIEGSGGEQNA